MTGVLLNIKVVAVKGLTSLTSACHGPPTSAMELSRELRFDLIPGRKGTTIVQSPDYSLDCTNGPWQLPSCSLLPHPT